MRGTALAFTAVVLLSACGGRGASNASQAANPACNNAGFLRVQAGFAGGSVSGDQLVDVCGTVTRVRTARRTRSGRHGYFYVAIPGATSGRIEVVANLDAMAEAGSGAPPAWPWVAQGDRVYVQGRYYYDGPQSQGIDWTEADADRNWPHQGYVVVCNADGKDCTKYQ